MKRPRLAGLVAVVAILCVVSLPLLAQGNDNKHQFKAHLRGAQETPAISTNATGEFSAVISHDETRIDFTLDFANLTANPTVAHIHFGQRNVAGGVSAFFCGGSTKPACPTATSGTVTGTIMAVDVIGPAGQGIAAGEFAELIRAIRGGLTYANIHNAPFPAGEIRGQLKAHDDD